MCDDFALFNLCGLAVRVKAYIENGWPEEIIDPDGGCHCCERLRNLMDPADEASCTLPLLPDRGDPGWIKSLADVQCISFSTIWQHLVERRVQTIECRAE